MQTDPVSELIDAMEAAFARVGVSDMYTGAQRLLAFLDRHRPHIVATQSRTSLETYLRADESDDAEFIQGLIQLCTAFGPLVEQFLLQNMQTMAESQPRKSGPPLRITVDQKREIVAHIGGLSTKGVLLEEAQKRSARRFGYSLRSIQRVWRERKQLAQQPFLSIQDVWKFIARDAKTNAQ